MFSSVVEFRGASLQAIRPFLACRSAELWGELSLAGRRVAADPDLVNKEELVLLIHVDGAGGAG